MNPDRFRPDLSTLSPVTPGAGLLYYSDRAKGGPVSDKGRRESQSSEEMLAEVRDWLADMTAADPAAAPAEAVDAPNAAEVLQAQSFTPEEVETILGVAEVRATFRTFRIGLIAGSYVTEGEITRGARARVLRESVVVYDGRIGSLRRFKDDVPTVAAGCECGIELDNSRDIKEGDVIEAYEVHEVAHT